jgi:hypothetical protein
MEFDSIICCHQKDFNTLFICIDGIKENVIGLRNIYVISKTDPKNDKCIWIDEKQFPFKISEIEKYTQSGREGWYFQQLLKLYSILIIDGILDKVLIVDADTIFLNKTKFEENGKICYCYGSEFHKPYFRHMNYLHHSFNKVLPFSGICHHMIIERKIIKEIFEIVEKKHNTDFWISFMKCTVIDNEKSEPSGASEYEIYFNYIFKNYPNNYIIRNLKWKNSSKLNLLLNDKKEGYNYVSYHFYMRE